MATIAEKYDYAIASVTVKDVENGKITINEDYANFVNQQAIVKFTLKNGDAALTVSTSSVKIGDNTYNVNTNEFYLAVPANSGNIEFTANDGTFNYTKNVENASFINGNFYNANVSMTKIKNTATTTAPTAKTLTFNGNQMNVDGSAQELITAGTTNGGEWQYKLGTDGEYSTTIPTATNAGSYTIYYKLVGDDDYEDIEEQSLTVNIAKADGFIERVTTMKRMNSVTITVGSHSGELSASTTDTDEELKVSVSGNMITITNEKSSGAPSASIITINATVTITSAATENYNEATTSVTIN